MREMRDTLRATFGRFLQLENRRRIVRRGTLEHMHAFESKIFDNAREVTIYLPPGYGDRSDTRYPVLYMQDGQNLFEPERAFIPGQHWQLREAADDAIADRTARPMIIVGIDNTGAQRVDEYTPTRDVERKMGGRADDYARFLLEELRPVIDERYRTMSGVENTAIGGSSLGGLLALYAGLTHAATFGSICAMSPSVWWDRRMILGVIDQFRNARRPRIWLDIGGREGRNALDDARMLRDRLKSNGWREEHRYFEDRRADHSERAWAKRARAMLEFVMR
jgi:predicted alpha/beta superfamily hydrolase